MIKSVLHLFSYVAALSLAHAAQPTDHLVFPGNPDLPGKAKHIVLLAGDEEYRSEESMPMLAQILTTHGFKCTVLFSMDAANKFVDPNNQKSLSNPTALDSADAILMALRFRNYPEATMDKFNAAFERGIPVVALRTSTHAFKIDGKDNKWAKYSWRSKKETGWERGFGRQVLGETWINHHGKHAVQGTLSVVEEANKAHTTLNGVGPIFGPTDVYGVKPLEPSTILLRGAVTASLEPSSKPIDDIKNKPMMPIAWTRAFEHKNGKTSKIFTTTMGSSTDLVDEDLRRLVVNGLYWGLDLAVPAKADVKLRSTFEPTQYGVKKVSDGVRQPYKKNQTPSDLMNVKKSK